jgi:hypothetical membrane protein
MIAPVWFLAALLAFAAFRPDYSHLTKAVSELGARGGPNALAWNILGFGAVGVFTMVFAWGLWAQISSRIGALLMGLSGLGFAAAGIFPADMGDLQSRSSQLHMIASLASFATFIPAVFVVGWVFWRRVRWGRFALAATAVGLVAMLSILLYGTTMPPALIQRFTFLAYLAWIALIAAGMWAARKRAQLEAAGL